MSESKAAIYHFTSGGNIRPIVYEKEINRIKKFALGLGFSKSDLYLDKSLRKVDQAQLKNLLQNADKYQAIVMKDFYHLSSNTGAFMCELIALSNKGVTLYTIEDGNFQPDKAPYEQPLKVAIYYCGLEIIGRSIELQFEIMEYFIKHNTNWKLVDKYADTAGNKSDSYQIELNKLIQNRDKYDIILVQSFNDIHWRTAKFCKIRHQIQLDIYSMHEDMYLKYEQGGSYEK